MNVYVDRRGNRKDLVIATKVRWSMGGMMPDLKKPNSHGLSRKHILEAVEASLKRLQTDYIDLYQVTQNNIIKTAFNKKQNLDKCSLPSSSLYNI